MKNNINDSIIVDENEKKNLRNKTKPAEMLV